MDTAQIHLTSTQLRNASEAQILAGTDKWAKNEKFATAMLITHLAELSAKRLYRDRSHSMFAYCTDVLRLDPGCVWLRLQVANCCRKFPELLDEIARGSISLSVAALLAPHLTSENKSSLIAAFQHKTKREAEELLADLHPHAAARSGIRACQIPLEGFPFTAVAYDHASHEMPVHAMTPPGGERAKIVPLGNQRYDLKFSFDGAQKAKLERLGELLGIAAHGNNLAALVERALDLALKAKDPQLKKVRNQSPSAPEDKQLPPTRYISMELKKAALARAEYCCQHQSSDGIRCKQKSALQFDHIHPFAWGGATQLENIKVLCAAHHRLKTEIQQGPWVRGEKSCKSG